MLKCWVYGDEENLSSALLELTVREGGRKSTVTEKFIERNEAGDVQGLNYGIGTGGREERHGRRRVRC